MEYPYLLLDAGGTLVFPDQELIARTLAAEGCELDSERFYEAHFRLIHQFDSDARQGILPTSDSLSHFFVELLIRGGAPKDAAERAVEKLVARHADVSLWTYSKPWVTETLAALRGQGVRMSVISNSDGRVRDQLETCGVTPYLETVFDSAIVGAEKPDPALFHHALNELGLAPTDAIYVGDIYHFDVVGANRAGIGAAHLDPLNCYSGWPGVHLRDIRELPGWLEEFADKPERFDLFPSNGR